MLAKLKTLTLQALAAAPVPAGVLVGYLAHPVIKFVIDAIKACLG